MSEVNKTQVGGTHYSRAGDKQHWDYTVDMLNNRYLEGCITKYVFRHRFKNGMVDLQKALHFCQKLLDCFGTGMVDPISLGTYNDAIIRRVFDYAKANELSIYETEIALLACTWRNSDDLNQLEACIGRLIELQDQHDRDLEAAKAGAAPTGAYVAQ